MSPIPPKLQKIVAIIKLPKEVQSNAKSKPNLIVEIKTMMKITIKKKIQYRPFVSVFRNSDKVSKLDIFNSNAIFYLPINKKIKAKTKIPANTTLKKIPKVAGIPK